MSAYKLSFAMVFVAILSVTAACGQTRKDVNVQEAKALLDKPSVTLLDVRTPSEYSAGHLKNAKNIDVTGAGFEQAIEKLDKKKPVVVYCAAGKRSAKAADIMTKAGFTLVYNVAGGYNAWIEAQLPTTK